jgi:hypothetical protein
MSYSTDRQEDCRVPDNILGMAWCERVHKGSFDRARLPPLGEVLSLVRKRFVTTGKIQKYDVMDIAQLQPVFAALTCALRIFGGMCLGKLACR